MGYQNICLALIVKNVFLIIQNLDLSIAGETFSHTALEKRERQARLIA